MARRWRGWCVAKRTPRRAPYKVNPSSCLDCYISGMAKERKSPQQKKQLEYTKDHFTFGWHSSRMFPTTWKRKKARANREYRRKSEELLAQAKPGIAVDDVELLADDLTAERFQKSVIRKRLHKAGTVTVGEKVKKKLERRKETAERRAQRRQYYDRTATSAIRTLSSLSEDKLVDVVRRADLLCGRRNADELKRVHQSNDAIDRALCFLYRLTWGYAPEFDALRRNQGLDKALRSWTEKANRILRRDQRAVETKLDEKQRARKKLTASRNP